MKIIEAYHCDYCKKYSKSKGVMTKHEKNCYHNPITKACASCANFKQEKFKCEVTDVFEIDSFHYRPSCVKGESLFTIDTDNPQGYKVTLKNNCELWEEEK